MSDATTETMPLSQTFQEAIIGWMFKDATFFTECILRLEPYMFADPKLGKIFELAFKLNQKFKHPPTAADVQNELSKDFPKHNELEIYTRVFTAACTISINMVSKDILESEMISWIKRAEVRKFSTKILEPLQKKNVDKVVDYIRDAAKTIESLKFAQDERKHYSIGALNRKEALDRTNACTMGNPWFDELLLEGSRIEPANLNDYCDIRKTTTGSLLGKELTIIIGPSNTGKTTMVCSIMAWNILMGKKVIYVSMEEKSENIFRKMISAVSGYERMEFSREPLSEKMKSVRDYVDHVLYTRFVMYEKFEVGTTSESVINDIEKRHKEEIAKTGSGFDLVVVDYPAILTSVEAREEKLQQWAAIAKIYTQFKNMAGRNGFHVIAPAQSTRGGYQTSVRSDSDRRMLDLADVGGSYGLTTVGDNVITINRSNENADARIIKFYIAKCRSAPKGTVFCSRTDFALSRTHGPELASTTLPASAANISDITAANTLGDIDNRNHVEETIGNKKKKIKTPTVLWHAARPTFDATGTKTPIPEERKREDAEAMGISLK